MGLSCLAEIATGLVDNGLQPTTPVAVIANGTTAQQREIIGTLGDIGRRAQQEPLPSPALLIVGDVVAARRQLIAPTEPRSADTESTEATPAFRATANG
jgi:siroheme synthase